MAVDDALRIASGARGVAHGRGLAFVEHWPGVAGLRGGQHLLVGGGLPEGTGVPGTGHHDVLDGGELVLDPGQQRHQRGVDDDHLVLGVIDHVGELLGEQAEVQGVQDRPHSGDGQVRLQVGLVVPQEGAHPIAVAHPDGLERLGQSLGSLGHLGERGLGELAGRAGDGDHLAVAVDLLAVAENATHQQRRILHRTQHDRPSPVLLRTSEPPDERAYRPPRPVTGTTLAPGGCRWWTVGSVGAGPPFGPPRRRPVSPTPL